MRARYPCLQVRSHNEQALKHVLKDACEQVHVEYNNTRLQTPASNGRGENSVRAMKEMIHRQKDAVFSSGIEFSIKHPLFALLVRHSEWILNHCSDDVIALHPDGVQRHHGERRVSPLDDLESNLRELKSALTLMTECDWQTLGCKTCQDVRYHEGWHPAECRERVLFATVLDTMYLVATTKRLLDTGASDARDDHESKRHKKF